jgi:hypothetical protein
VRERSERSFFEFIAGAASDKVRKQREREKEEVERSETYHSG